MNQAFGFPSVSPVQHAVPFSLEVISLVKRMVCLLDVTPWVVDFGVDLKGKRGLGKQHCPPLKGSQHVK